MHARIEMNECGPEIFYKREEISLIYSNGYVGFNKVVSEGQVQVVGLAFLAGRAAKKQWKTYCKETYFQYS